MESVMGTSVHTPIIKITVCSSLNNNSSCFPDQRSPTPYNSEFTNVSFVGPVTKTLVDFWRLIWQEKPPVIVMVTNVKEEKKIKCHQYWSENGSISYGPFRVELTKEQALSDYTIREMQLTVSNKREREREGEED